MAYPNVIAPPASSRIAGPSSRPAMRGRVHASQVSGESVYAAKFRAAPSAIEQDAVDVAAARAEVEPTLAIEAARRARMEAAARASVAGQRTLRGLIQAAAADEMTPARAAIKLQADADTQRARIVADTNAQRQGRAAVPVMANGALAIADASSDPVVAAARAAELRSSWRAPAAINPLGLALTAPTSDDQAASAAWLPEVPNSQAAAASQIAARARRSSLLGDATATPSLPSLPWWAWAAAGYFLLVR